MNIHIFRDLYSLPIKNYHFLINTKNLAWLTNKPHARIRNIERLRKIYDSLIEKNLNEDKNQFDFAVNQQKKYYDIVLAYFKFFDNKEDKNLEQKVLNALQRYINFMDSTFTRYQIAGKEYESLKDFYAEVLKTIDYSVFLENLIYIFNYNNFKYENRNKFDLYAELPNIQKYYGFQINIEKTSVKEYFSLRDKMIEQANKENDGR